MSFLLIALVAVMLTLAPVQTALARWLSGRLSAQLGTTITLERVAIGLDGSVRLEEVFVSDLHGDTLFQVPSLKIRGLRVHPRRHLVRVSELDLEQARFKLATAQGDEHSNLTNLLDRLTSSETESAGADWTIECALYRIADFHFSFHNANSVQQPFGVDFEHIEIPDASIVGERLEVIGDSIATHLSRLAFSDGSGFTASSLSGLARVSSRGVVVEEMDLGTPSSRLIGKLALQSESWADFNDFISKVMLRVDLEESSLDMADIAWFAPELEGIRFPMTVSGRVRGTVDDLKGRGMRIGFGHGSWFTGTAELSGLPRIAETFMLIDVDEMHVTQPDLGRVPVPPFTAGKLLELPEEARLLGDIDLTGRFTGFLRAFTATGRARTALGELRTDISYERDTLRNRVLLAGRAATQAFHLGPLIGSSAVGPMNANVRLSAKGRDLRSMEMDLEGDFPLFTVNNRTIGDIRAKGHLARNLFNGELEANDPNLQLRFSGLADFRGRWPEVDFMAKLQHADLRELGFTKDRGYSGLSMDVIARGRLSPDSLQGDLNLTGISYCQGNEEFDLGNVNLRSDRIAGANVLSLDATFAEAEVVGAFLPTKLPAALDHVVRSVFPSLSSAVRYDQDVQDFRFTVRVRDAEEVLRLFLPGASIAQGSTFVGSFDTRSFDLGLHAVMPKASYGQTRFDSLVVIADKTLDLLAFSARSSRQHFGDSLWFSGSGVTGKAYQDELDIDLGWKGSSGGTNGNLSFYGEVQGPRSLMLELLPSKLFFGRGLWENAERARFRIDSSTIQVDGLAMRNGAQFVAFNGTIARDPEQALAFDLRNVELANFAPLLDGPMIQGLLSADGRLFDVFGTPHVNCAANADSVRVKDRPVGDFALGIAWLEGQGALDITGTLKRGVLKALDFSGRVGLRDGGRFDLVASMDRFDLSLVNPYLPEGLSRITGLATGRVSLTGPIERPDLDGAVDLTNAGLRIDYLNTHYIGDAHVRIGDELFMVEGATMRDEEGHVARVGATVGHIGFRHWSYDIWGSLDRVQVLNTTVAMNSLYYGTAYASGDFAVSGSDGRLEVTVQATTAQGTDIHMPVGGSTEVSPISFVHFSSADANAEDLEVDLSGVALDMDITVTPDARFELIFDPTVGDIMSGRGAGMVELGITPRGDLSMSGMVEITEGDYLFTLRNIVNKRFQVQPGGRITWYGDPFDAQLDLQAIYRLKAPLYDIIPPAERTEAYRQRVPVEVRMKLREKLMNPEIGFDVRLTTVDESVKAQVASVLSTDQEMSRQVFALIVLNRFLEPPMYAGAGAAASGTGAAAGTTASELLSNQVSNWLSGLSNDFDLGFNYRPGDNITQDELEVAFSKQFFNQRLLFSTNVGVQYGARDANASNSLIGDFQLEYLITREGRFRARAYSLTTDRNLNQADQAPTTQGAGLVLRRDFDRFGDLFRRKKPAVAMP